MIIVQSCAGHYDNIWVTMTAQGNELYCKQSNKAITVEPTSNLSEARDLMIRYNISRIIVATNNNPVGMITEKAIAGFLFKNSHEPLDTIAISKRQDLRIKLDEIVSQKKELSGLIRSKDWPKTPLALGNRINEIIPNLNEIGVVVHREYDKHSKSNNIIITDNNYSPPAECNSEYGCLD